MSPRRRRYLGLLAIETMVFVAALVASYALPSALNHAQVALAGFWIGRVAMSVERFVETLRKEQRDEP